MTKKEPLAKIVHEYEDRYGHGSACRIPDDKLKELHKITRKYYQAEPTMRVGWIHSRKYMDLMNDKLKAMHTQERTLNEITDLMNEDEELTRGVRIFTSPGVQQMLSTRHLTFKHLHQAEAKQ